jgi:uncharacterized protein (TIGR03792 family)
MVIEWLTYRVPAERQADFLAADAAIWTPALAAQPGFRGKEIWRAAAAPDVINLIIRWETRAAWQAVPQDVLAAAEARFRAAAGADLTVERCVDLDVIG